MEGGPFGGLPRATAAEDSWWGPEQPILEGSPLRDQERTYTENK